MFQSLLPNFIRHQFPSDEEAFNARLLIRAGFVDKVMAGVYSYLPLGLLVLKKVENIIRARMNEIGASEILMSALTPKENWDVTGRWDSLDVLFHVISKDKREYALGATHEEIVVPLMREAIFSYKDLPAGVYQIQTKFRDEARPKSGLLRGREFLMKDLYSFHTDKDDLERYYEHVSDAYRKIFSDLALDAHFVEASGGSFSKFSHEFQVFHENGEDTIVFCAACGFAQNKEICSLADGEACPVCEKKVSLQRAIEVGNIFQLNTKYSDPFSFQFKDVDGNLKPVIMGCYGIGVSRLMGTLAEVFHDDKGLVWPASVAPFGVHLLVLFGSSQEENNALLKQASLVYDELQSLGVEILFDDRRDRSAGEKFAESDLIGIPLRLVISKKTEGKIEIKKRSEEKTELVDFSSLKQYFSL